MRELTVVFPHFMNLGMLAEQRRVWADYSPEARQHLHVIVVDDCSPKGHRPSLKDVESDLASISLYRLTQKKRWNWLACRNLGAQFTTTEWMLLTDIDHVIPPATMQTILTMDLDPKSVYRFKRVTAQKKWPFDVDRAPAYKPHNDTWLLTRDLFFRKDVYGYDERLSGCYGTSSEFTDRLVRAAKFHMMLNEAIIRYPREVIPDASTLPSVYTRKNDEKNDVDLKNRKTKRAYEKNWKPLHGLTPWERVL